MATNNEGAYEPPAKDPYEAFGSYVHHGRLSMRDKILRGTLIGVVFLTLALWRIYHPS